MSKAKSQHEKFKEAAKELECDEDEKRFDANVKKLAKSRSKKDDLTKQPDSESIEEGNG